MVIFPLKVSHRLSKIRNQGNVLLFCLATNTPSMKSSWRVRFLMLQGWTDNTPSERRTPCFAISVNKPIKASRALKWVYAENNRRWLLFRTC